MRRTGITVLGLAVLAGLGGIALLPGNSAPNGDGPQQPTIAAAMVTSPSPALLQALDRAVSAPPTSPPISVADVQDSPETSPEPVTASATPAVAVTPSIAPEALTPDAYVGSSAVHLRAGPSSSSDILSVLQAGEPLQTAGSSGGWVQVTAADGRSGWVYSSLLTDSEQPADSAQVAATNTATAAVPTRATLHSDGGDLTQRTALIADDLSGYSTPDVGSADYTLQAGQRVRILEVRGDWLRVQTPSGLSMWIRASAGT